MCATVQEIIIKIKILSSNELQHLKILKFLKSQKQG